MNLLLAAVLSLATPVAAPDVAVVCPDEFVPALTPWIEYRQAQGHHITLVKSDGSPEQIRARIRQVAEPGALRSIVLVGDAEPNGDADSSARQLCVPTQLIDAQVNVRYGSEPQIASDNWYADLDGDQVPDVAIGRLTADSAEELAQIVEKIIAYERQPDFGNWRRRVNLIAGVGGFGALTDAVIETVARKIIADGIPASYGTSMTYASWRSPFCPDPRAFAQVTRERLNEGCLFWVYMGHGHRQSLDLLQVPGGQHRIFDVRDVEHLTCEGGSPIALFMACYTGAFDGPIDCLAEELLRTPGAPVAVIAGSRVTMPYAMALLGTNLIDQCFVEQRTTLGEALLEAKRQMVAEQPVHGNRAVLNLLASALSPSAEALAAERLEHLHLFNLLGDPLLRLRHPQPIELSVPEQTFSGSELVLKGNSPLAGQATVELVARRDRLTFRPPSRSRYNPLPEALANMQTVYEQANNLCYTQHEVTLEAGEFHLTLPVPPEAWGACHVRVYIAGNEDFGMGAADVEVSRGR